MLSMKKKDEVVWSSSWCNKREATCEQAQHKISRCFCSSTMRHDGNYYRMVKLYRSVVHDFLSANKLNDQKDPCSLNAQLASSLSTSFYQRINHCMIAAGIDHFEVRVMHS